MGPTTTQFAKQRSVPRFNFIASVEISDPVSGVRLDGRISEISRKGCYIDVLNTLPTGTSIQMRISRDRGSFTTAAKVIYAQEPMGMGIAFEETAPDQMKVLDSWLEEVSA